MSSLIKKNSDNSLKFVYSDNNSLSVIFHDNEILIGVVGEFNKNLKELEKITETSLYSRGNSILIKSNPEKNEIVKNAIKFLANQFINNGSIENKDILSTSPPASSNKTDRNFCCLSVSSLLMMVHFLLHILCQLVLSVSVPC